MEFFKYFRKMFSAGMVQNGTGTGRLLFMAYPHFCAYADQFSILALMFSMTYYSYSYSYVLFLYIFPKPPLTVLKRKKGGVPVPPLILTTCLILFIILSMKGGVFKVIMVIT